MQETLALLGQEDLLEKGQATHSSILGLNAGDLGLIPGLGRSPGEGKGYLLQYSGLENSTDRIYPSHQPGQLLLALAARPVLSPLHLYP